MSFNIIWEDFFGSLQFTQSDRVMTLHNDQIYNMRLLNVFIFERNVSFLHHEI